MGLSGRPHKLSNRVREGGLPSPEESGLSSDRQRSVNEFIFSNFTNIEWVIEI